MTLGLDNSWTSFLWSHYRVSESASSFATHIHDLHKDISDKIEHNNLDYRFELTLERNLKLLILAIL